MNKYIAFIECRFKMKHIEWGNIPKPKGTFEQAKNIDDEAEFKLMFDMIIMAF